MTRAAVSIPANIAEGSSCSTNKHYRQYINTALGSSYELETLLLITRDTQEIDPSVIDPIIDLTIEEQRMLSAFLRKLN
jgi:four helix bundle protein